MFVRSERLFLRPGWPEDWQELFGLIHDEDIMRNLATAPWPFTLDHAREFAGSVQQTGLPHFFITLPTAEGARLIGCIGLRRYGDDVELALWIARDQWGRGYATEASRAVLNVARALGHRRIVSGHFIDNPASGRVLEKAGFSKTGKQTLRFNAVRGGKAAWVQFAVELGGSESDDPDSDDEDMRMVA